jgi:hypothetical protein
MRAWPRGHPTSMRASPACAIVGTALHREERRWLARQMDVSSDVPDKPWLQGTATASR